MVEYNIFEFTVVINDFIYQIVLLEIYKNRIEIYEIFKRDRDCKFALFLLLYLFQIKKYTI